MRYPDRAVLIYRHENILTQKSPRFDSRIGDFSDFLTFHPPERTKVRSLPDYIQAGVRTGFELHMYSYNPNQPIKEFQIPAD